MDTKLSIAARSQLPDPHSRQIPRAPFHSAKPRAQLPPSSVPQSEMHLRPIDRLLLHQQSRPNLDLSANAKRIDSLIADRLHGMRTNHLPVIILRAVVASCTACPSAKPNQIDFPPPLKSATSNTDAAPAGWSSMVNFAFASPSQISATACTRSRSGNGDKNKSSAPLLSRSATCSRTSPLDCQHPYPGNFGVSHSRPCSYRRSE